VTAAGTPLSILVVDDDVDFCESLATILRSDQVEVRTDWERADVDRAAQTLAEALRAAARH